MLQGSCLPPLDVLMDKTDEARSQSFALQSLPPQSLRHEIRLRQPAKSLAPSRRTSILPVPDSLQELHHVHTLTFHFDHPRMLQHAPGCGAAFGLFFETKESKSANHVLSDCEPSQRGKKEKYMDTYQHSIKYLKFSLHLIFSSGSSFSLGIG